MAHEIESLGVVGKTPWHGIGTKVENGFISPKEFMQATGLDWKVRLEDAFLGNGVKIPRTKVSVRESDNKIFGTVGDRYHVLQNEDAFNWFTPFIESKEASFETAGALKEGRVIWVLAKANINAKEVVKGDPVESYILLSHSHDGTLSIRSGFTQTRVVCCNTLNAALNSSSSKLLKLKHTRNATIALEKVREVMDIANKEFIASTEQYKFLASKAINKKDLEKYVKLVFGKEDEEREMRQSTIDKIEYLFENGRGHEVAGKNYWGAYNAINEFLNYEQGRTTDSRLHSLWFGINKTLDMKALQIATKMANGETL